jgi:hypothetical protein
MPASKTRTISAEQLDFSEAGSTAVVSDSLRYILPVPGLADGGEPWDHPAGERAGQSFTDRHGRPIKGRGVVFFDPDDQSWEAAPGDGTGVIIFSPITPGQAQRLNLFARSLRTDPERLTLDEIKAIVAFAIVDLAISSAHASNRTFVREAMLPEEDMVSGGLGLYRRRADHICRAVYVAGAGRFLGPAASPQKFRDGAVILQHGDDVRLVQPTSFEATYRLLDGRPALVELLTRQEPA